MRLSIIAIVLLFSANEVYGQTGFPSYFSLTDLSAAPPGALKFGLYGYDNPSLLNTLHQPDMLLTLSDWKVSSFNRWGLFAAVPHVGFGFVKTTSRGSTITDYRLSVGFGSRSLAYGLSYGWTGGDRSAFARTNSFALGILARPSAYVSVGLTGTVATSGNGREGVTGLAVRPLGSEVVTLFGDYAIQNGQSLKDGSWSAGAVVEPLPGVRVTGRYIDSKSFALGVQLSLGSVGISSHAGLDRSGQHNFTTYGIRLGAYDRTMLSRLGKRSKYAELNLHGSIKYRRYILFDESHTLARIISAIDAAQQDQSIAGLAINTSGMRADREILWEVREKLKQFKATGKKVVVFIDRASMDEYHFASVADRIVLDPTGMILLQGYVTGRTFLKGTLEKLGIGYDEWRFFRYKSANENLSRDLMSDADREQRQDFVNEFYRLARADISGGRNFTPEQFDQLINEDVVFLPQDALAKGLVDTLGRWDGLGTIIESLERTPKRTVSPYSLERFKLPPDNLWGERDRIAIIYALGVCAMDEGIRARTLVKDVDAAGKDPRVKAIVLRVDSPGGDGMASDYIAEAMKRARKNKPVIVSQGTLAASGGYWLSMYADTIVSAPTTLTGSIGVIGGWMFDAGLKEKLGMSTDLVKAGQHADLGFGFRLPFIGAGLPDRNFTPEERTKVERVIKTFYKQFVEKVAEGREMSYQQVDSIAEGRVWTGSAAITRGLVDVLGGLDEAVQIAKRAARIPADKQVEIVEMPRPGLIDPSAFMPRLFGFEIPRPGNPLLEHLEFLLKHNGQPLPMMPLDQIDFDIE